MHDISNLIQVLGGPLGAVATFFAVIHKSKKEEYDDIIDNLHIDIKDLKGERDSYKKEYQLEHEQRIEAEAEASELKKEIFVLNSKINELKK